MSQLSTPRTLLDPADEELKARHRTMWALGDYPAVAKEIVPTVGRILTRAAGIHRGQRVLDVACGSGNATIPAALAGARVVGHDLTPELLEAGEAEAQRLGLDIEWRSGDAEALEFGDNTFDTVISALGVMFTPHHQQAADELMRVVLPGGTIGLLSWTPEGFVGQMFSAMKPYAPAPPPGAQPPPLWGSEAHVRDLFRDRVRVRTVEHGMVSVTRFATPEEFRDYFKSHYGPIIATYRTIADDPGRTADLDAALVGLARRFDVGAGSLAMAWEYLLLTGAAS